MDRAHLTAGSDSSVPAQLDFGYDLDLDQAVELIRKSGAARVGLQAPEGLKRATPAIAGLIAGADGLQRSSSPGTPALGPAMWT